MIAQQINSINRALLFCMTIVALVVIQAGGVFPVQAALVENTLPVNYAVVFVSRKIPTQGSVYYPSSGSMPGVMPYSRFQVSAPGKLMVREVNGTLRTLVDGANPTAASLNLIDVNGPEVSYDATRIVFAGLTAGTYSREPVKDPGAWRIYVINVNGTGLRQITFSDQGDLDLSQFRDVASNFKKYDDLDPAWLPDGRIVFSSTRWPSFGQYGGVRTTNLYIVNENGTGLHRITAERNGAERAQIDPLTGKIVYSRWWRNYRVAANDMNTITYSQGGYIMKDGLLNIVYSKPNGSNEVGGFKNLERNSWHLATINPDGTDLAQFAGRSNTYLHGQLVNHAYGGGFAPDGSFYANFFPMLNGTEAAGFGGIRHYERGPKGYTAIIGVNWRDDSKMKLVRYNPPSYGIYVSDYAADPEVLPDGRLIISLAHTIAQDYGLYTINSDGTGLASLYDNPGTTELRARLIRPRVIPPIIPDRITQVASKLPPLADGPYDIDGTFTFDAMNVYFNAPVDVDILSAMPVGSANTIRFFIDHQRWQQHGSIEAYDWPILMKETQILPDGSVTVQSPANVPLFEQIRSKKTGYDVPLTGGNALVQEMGGAAHVAGMNFARPGDVVRCVGCHAGHSMIPVPENLEDAKWSNLAPGAAIAVSSLNSSLPNSKGLIDRRVKMVLKEYNANKYWLSKAGLAPNTQWAKLTFPVPVTVRTVRLYNIPVSDSSIRVLNATVRLYNDPGGTNEVASSSSGALSENGTDVSFNDVYARVVRIEFNSVNGLTAGLGEIEVIARAEEEISTDLPGVPKLLAPVNTAIVNEQALDLDWDDSIPEAHHYQIQISANEAFTALVADVTNVMASDFNVITELDPGERYYWRVRGFNTYNMPGGWSTVWNFRTPLGKPVLVSPVCEASLNNNHPDFDWEAVTNASGYILQVAPSNSFGTLLVNVTVNETEYQLPMDLPQNKTLYWRVKAKNSVLTGQSSEPCSFKTGNPPSIPDLVAPANNALVKNYTPKFDWKDSLLPASTTFKRYEIQVDNNNDFSSPEIDISTTDGVITESSFAPFAELIPNTKYFWRVRAINLVGVDEHVSNWSMVRSLRAAMLPPVLLSPGNQSVVTTRKPFFDWTNVIGAANYTIQISYSPGFSTFLVNIKRNVSDFTPTTNLPKNKTLYWRVRANGPNGPSEWSTFEFITPP